MQARLLNNDFFLGVVVQWIILGALSALFPGMTLGNGVALFGLIAASLAVTAYMPYASRGATVTMAVVTLLLGIGVILNAWFYTTYLGGTPGHPVLVNVDCYRWWNDALYHIGYPGEKACHSNGLYGYVLAGVLWLFGVSVGTALLWSMSLIVAGVLLTGLLTYRLTESGKTAVTSMIATASVCYWLSMGTLILKDAFVIDAMLIGAVGLTTKDNKAYYVWIASAAVMLALTRPSCLALLFMGLLLLVRRDERMWGRIVITAVIFGVMWSLPVLYGQLGHLKVSFSHQDAAGYSYTAPQQMALFNMIGNYPELPLYKKMLYLPLSAGVQFFIPFVWTMARDIPFGLTEAWAHIGFPWYVFGFCTMYFLIGQRRNYSSPTYRMAVWAVICWLVPCFLLGGTVSRYGLPFVALMSPAVATVIMTQYRNKSFYGWLCCFCAVGAIVLTVAYKLQTAAAQ